MANTKKRQRITREYPENSKKFFWVLLIFVLVIGIWIGVQGANQGMLTLATSAQGLTNQDGDMKVRIHALDALKPDESLYTVDQTAVVKDGQLKLRWQIPDTAKKRAAYIEICALDKTSAASNSVKKACIDANDGPAYNKVSCPYYVPANSTGVTGQLWGWNKLDDSQKVGCGSGRGFSSRTSSLQQLVQAQSPAIQVDGGGVLVAEDGKIQAKNVEDFVKEALDTQSNSVVYITNNLGTPGPQGQAGAAGANGLNGADGLDGAAGIATVSGGGLVLTGSNLSLDPSCLGGQVLQWDGSNWGCASVAGTDSQTLSLAANVLAISGGNSVNLSGYLDNTDSQALSWVSGTRTLSLTGGGSVVISDTDTTYSAGNGLSLGGTTFSINSPTCAGTTKLTWNGSAFSCAADVDTDTDTTNFNIAAQGTGGSQNIASGDTVTFNNGTGTTATRSGGTVTYSLNNTAVSAGTYSPGDNANGSLALPQFTVDAQGRLTAASTTNVTLTGISNSQLVNSGITVNTTGGLTGGSSVSLGGSINLSLDLSDSGDGATVTTNSGSGLEVSGGEIGLIRGCSSNQLLKWNSTSLRWECASDTDTDTDTGVTSVGTIDSQAKSANGAVISGTVVYLQTADVSNPGLVSTGTQTFAGDKTFSGNVIANGNLTANGDVTLGDAAADGITITGEIRGASPLAFEGATNDGVYTTFAITDPTLARTITFPDRSGTVSLSGDIFTGDVTGTLNASGATTLTIAANSVALGTDTTGDYVTNVTAGGGLTGSATGEGSTPTLAIVSSNGGIVVNADDIALTIAASADALSATTSSGSGLEILSSGLTLLQGCSDGQLLKWNETTDVWGCSIDIDTDTGVTTIGTLDSLTKSANGAVISGSTLVLQTADGSNPGLVSTGTQTFAGAKTFTGTTTIKPAVDGNALLVENSSGGSVFTVETSTGYAFATLGSTGLDSMFTLLDNASNTYLSTGSFSGSSFFNFLGDSAAFADASGFPTLTIDGVGRDISVGGGADSVFRVVDAAGLFNVLEVHTASGGLLSTATDIFQVLDGTASAFLISANGTNGRVAVGSDASLANYKFEVAGDINISSGSVYRANGTAGLSSVTCSGGQFLQNQNIRAGLTTAGTCANGGVNTVGTFSGSSIANGASISGTTITFGPADATNPGMVSTGTQTFAGNKTLTGTTTISGTGASTKFRVLDSGGFSVLNVSTSGSGAVTIGASGGNAPVFTVRNNSQNVFVVSSLAGTLVSNLGSVDFQNTTGSTSLLSIDEGTGAVGIGYAPGAAVYPLDVIGEINTDTGYRVAGTAGANTTCSGGQVLQNLVATGGIVTAGTCAADAGVTSIGTIDSQTKSANGAVISGTTLVLQTADATMPGLVSTGTQTFAGNKTFTGGLTATGTALFQNSSDSTTAFQIQNAAGTSNLFIADTTNSRVGIGASPATSLLTIGTNTTAASGGLTFGTDVNLYRNATDTLRTDDNLLVRTTTDSINAFRVQDSTGASLLRANTSTKSVNVAGALNVNPSYYSSGTMEGSDYPSAGDCVDIYVKAGIAYVLCDDALYIYNVSVPASPVLLGSIATGSTPTALYVQGDYAYVTHRGGTDALQVFNIADPTNPVLAGSKATGSDPVSIDIQGKYAYVLNETSETLQVFDISTTTPVNVASGSTGTTPRTVKVQDSYAYVTNTGDDTLQIIDVSSFPTLSTTGSVAVAGSGNAYALDVQGQYAYVTGTYWGTLESIDISDPASPSLVSATVSTVRGSAIKVYGRYAYVSDNTSSGDDIKVVSISNPSSMSPTGSYVNAGGFANNVFIENGYVYAVVWGGFESWDLEAADIHQLRVAGLTTGSVTSLGNANFNKDVSIDGGLSVSGSSQFRGDITGTGTVNFQNASNSTNALQVANSAGEQIVNVDTTSDNLITNSSFENDTTGWAGKASGTIAQNTTQQYSGNASALVSTAFTANRGTSYSYALASSTTYTFSGYFKSNYTNSITLNIGYSEDGSTDTACNTAFSPDNTGWSRFSCTFTTGTTSGSPYVYVTRNTAGLFTNGFYLDGVTLKAESVASPFGVGGLSLNGVITSPIALKNQSDSDTAFTVQSADNTGLFQVNTRTKDVIIGGDDPLSPFVHFDVDGRYATIDAGGIGGFYAWDSINGSGINYDGGSEYFGANVNNFIITDTSGAVQGISFDGTTGNVGIGLGIGSANYTFDVDGDINISSGSVYRYNGTAGTTTTCSGGQILLNPVLQGGITTAGTCTSGAVTSIGTIDSQTKSANGAVISGNSLVLQTADASFPGLVSTGTQSFAGNKTFTGNVITNGSLQVDGSTVLGDAATDTITANGSMIANATATGTTDTTSGTGTNTTTVTIAGTAFANGDVILIDNAGQDYYTRVVSGGGTSTLTVSPAVTFENARTVTKYNIQNIGATPTDYTTTANRFFQGYFLGGVVAGAGTTTLSDGRLAATTGLNFDAPNYTFTNTSDSTSAFKINKANGESLVKFDTATTNNLLSNGTFDTNTTGWSAKGSATVSHNTSNAQVGLGSLQVANTAAANDGAKIDYALTSQTKYTLTFYAKLSFTTTTSSTISVGRTEDGSTDSDCATGQTINGGGWSKITCSFTTADVSGTNNIYIKQSDATARTIYVDSVQLESQANVNANTDFETDYSGWTTYNAPGLLQQSTDQAYTGTGSLQVNTSTYTAAQEGVAIGGPYQPNTIYHASFMVWLDSATASSRSFSILERTDNTDAVQGSTCTSQTVTADTWTNVSCTFTTGPVVNGSPFVALTTLDAGDFSTYYNFYVDNAVVAPVKWSSNDIGRISLNGSIDSPLTVRGAQDSTSALQVQQQNGKNVLTVDTLNGRVGINTDTPTKDLEVNGQALFKATTTSTNTLEVQGTTGLTAFNVVGSTRSVHVGYSSSTTNATLLVYGTGLVKTMNTAGSASAFSVQDSANANVLTVSTSTSNKLVYIGEGGIDAKFQVINTSSTPILDIDSAGGGIFGASFDDFQVYASSGGAMIISDGVGNTVTIGDADDGASADTTLFVVDSASTANLPTGINGGIAYDSQTNKFKIFEGGAYKTLCNTTDLGCAATAVTTVGAFSGSSIANGASISGNTITFGPADGTNPGMITTGTQTIAGAKTFSSTATFSGNIHTGNGIIQSTVADGAGAKAFQLNTSNNYTTSGADLLVVSNWGVEKFSVDKDGTIDGTGNLAIDGNATLGDGDGVLQSWTSTVGPGVSRSESGYAAANGYVYAIGGAGGSTSVYYTKINADGSLGTWQTTASLGTSRDQLTAAAANGYVYAIGGNGLSSVEYAKINADGSLGAWQTTSSTNSNRSRASATVANGYVYIVGSTLNATTEYAKINADGSLGAWTVGSSLGVQRYGNATVATNGYIYAIGGNTGLDSAVAEYATLNPTTGAIGTWTSTTSMNNARNITRGVVANGHIYISGGFNVDTTEYTSINSDGTLDAWQTGPVMTDTRWGHGMITANGYIYSISGDGTTTAESTSIPRTKISGALDLVGFDPGSLGVSGSGGSLTAGNTMIVGTLDVQDRANFLQGVSVGQHLSVAGDFALAGALVVNSCTNTSTNILCAGGNTRAADITIGTNDNNALIFETNNTAVGRFTNTGELLINTATNTLNAQLVVNSTAGKDTGMNIIGNVNSFYQINIQNTNSGASASSDFVATANNGTATTYYVDFGINGSGGGAAPFTGANDAYLYASDSNNLHIGALGSSGALKFYTTGGTSSPVQRLSINASGQAVFDAVNSSGTGYTFNANSVTTGTALQVNATSLTTGLAFQVVGAGGKNLLRIQNDTAMPLDDEYVIIGEGGISAAKPDSLARDQLYVFGRINSSWNMFTQDFLSGNPAVAADGLFMNGYYDENIGTGGTSPSGQIQMQNTTGASGMARLTFTGTLGTGPWASNWGTGGNLVTERSLNPVFEARVQASSNTDVRHIVGFTDMALNATTSADTNNSANEVFFRKTAAGTNWEAVTRNGSGTENVTTLATACAGSSACTTSALRTMRIELENVGANGTARFYIDGTLVATHTTTAVPANTNRLGWLLTNTPTTTTYSGRTLDMDYVRVWSDDPPDSVAPEGISGGDGLDTTIEQTQVIDSGDTPPPEDNSNEALLERIKTLESDVDDLKQYKDVLTTETLGDASSKKAIFIADVEFRKQVEFSADALFKANVNVDGTLNANGRVVVSNNTGTITMQPGQTEIQVLFAKPLISKPNVFLSTENPDVKVVAQTRTANGFIIKLSEPITEPLDVQWFAVEKE